MPIYTCNICNYTTKLQTNYNRHNESNRHITNVADHNKTVNELNINIKNNIEREYQDKLKIIQDEYNKMCSFYEERISNLIYENNLNKHNNNDNNNNNSINNNITINANTINTYTFVNINFQNAPQLEKFSAIGLISSFGTDPNHRLTTEEDYNIFMYQIYKAHKINGLHVVLGEIIKQIYIKEDETQQSIWSTDSSRMNYIYKEVREWVKDIKES